MAIQTGNPQVDELLNRLMLGSGRENTMQTMPNPIIGPQGPLPINRAELLTGGPSSRTIPSMAPEPPKPSFNKKEFFSELTGNFLVALGAGLSNRGKRNQSTGAGAAIMAPMQLAMQKQAQEQERRKLMAQQAVENLRLRLEAQRVENDTSRAEVQNQLDKARTIEALRPPVRNIDPNSPEGIAAAQAKDAPRLAVQERIAEARAKVASDEALKGRQSREKIAQMQIQAAAARALASGKNQKSVSQAMTLAQRYDTNPITKNFAVVKQALDFVKTLGPTSTDDQALIYAFAKAMDPDSVVREGEYATVQKYAQSWAEAFGFQAQRVFSNSPFLSATARKQIVETIGKKAKAVEATYRNFRDQTADKLKAVGEDPDTWLIEYGGAKNPYK